MDIISLEFPDYTLLEQEEVIINYHSSFNIALFYILYLKKNTIMKVIYIAYYYVVFINSF